MKINFGARVLGVALDDLHEGTYIETSPNHGDAVEARFFRPNDLAPGQPWCAAAVRTWVTDAAAALGVKPPVLGPVLARGWIPAFQAVGGWKDGPLTPDDVEPGDVLIWKHALTGRDPAYAMRGHIALFERMMAGGLARSLDGNSGVLGDRIAEMPRRLDDPLLLGRGRFPPVEVSTLAAGLGGPSSSLPLLALFAGVLTLVSMRRH